MGTPQGGSHPPLVDLPELSSLRQASAEVTVDHESADRGHRQRWRNRQVKSKGYREGRFEGVVEGDPLDL